MRQNSDRLSPDSQLFAVTVAFFPTIQFLYQMLSQLIDPLRVGGIIDCIVAFVRIGCQVEIKLLAGLGVPDVFVGFGYNKVHGIHAQSVFAVNVISGNRVQHTVAVYSVRYVGTCKLQQCGHYIPKLNQVIAGSAVCADVVLRSGQEKRHLSASLIRFRFLEHQMIAQHFTMVRDKENYCVVHQLLLYQC